MQQTGGMPVFDRHGLIERLGGDVELVDEVIGIFLDESAGMLESVRGAVADRDAHRVERAAHSLKGALLNISAEAAAQRALDLEEAGRTGRVEACRGLVAELEAELDRLHESLS